MVRPVRLDLLLAGHGARLPRRRFCALLDCAHYVSTPLAEGVRRMRAALGQRQAKNRFYALVTRPTEDAAILGLAEELAARGANNRLLAIQTLPSLSAPPVVEPVEAPQANLNWLRVGTRSESLGMRFDDPDDDAQVRALVLDFAASL